MTPKALELFLRNSVFYPCSGLDPTPVRFLAKQFQSFFYADYQHISRNELEAKSRSHCFPGYGCDHIEDLDVRAVFGCSWDQIEASQKDLISKLTFDWKAPFVALASFHRLPDCPTDHGPAHFDLMFARCEAIMAFQAAYSRLHIAPRCVAYIIPGMGKGGNFAGFPKQFGLALRQCPGGLPQFLLYDELGGDRKMGDYLDLIQQYRTVQEWDYEKEYWGSRHLTFAKLSATGKSGQASKGR